MAERTNAGALKASEVKASGGSNPSLAAGVKFQRISQLRRGREAWHQNHLLPVRRNIKNVSQFSTPSPPKISGELGRHVMAKLARQVTPPAWRIWSYGIAATAFAALANYGWLYLAAEVFNWNLLVPKTFSTTELTTLTDVRVIAATVIAGLVATFGATVLAKLVIGPKIWWLIIGFGAGLASLYGALTLANVDLSVRLGLSVMHIIATFSIVIPIGWSLEIRDQDLKKAVDRYSTHLEAKNPSAQQSDTVHPTAVISTEDISKSVIGQDVTDAIAKIEAVGLKARITRRDTEVFTTTFDFREDRINLEVENGIVVSTNVG